MNPKRKKQLLIAGGVAVALLAVVLLLKKKSSAENTYEATTSEPKGAEEPGAGAATAGDLEGFARGLESQLPGIVASGALAAQQAASAQAQGERPAFAEEVANDLQPQVTALLASRTGEQGSGATSNNSPTVGKPTAKKTKHPAAKKPAAKPKPTTKATPHHAPAPRAHSAPVAPRVRSRRPHGPAPAKKKAKKR